jgi:hypothetical protein
MQVVVTGIERVLMPDFNSSSWKHPYLEALRESNKERLSELVYVTEGAILLRLLELGDSADYDKERDEIDAAYADLLTIKIHKLGWPPSMPSKPTR